MSMQSEEGVVPFQDVHHSPSRTCLLLTSPRARAGKIFSWDCGAYVVVLINGPHTNNVLPFPTMAVVATKLHS